MRNIAAALIWTKNNDRVIKIKHIESHFNREFWYCGDGPRPKWHGPTGWKYLLWVLNYKWGLNSQYVHKRYDARYGIYELVVFEFEEGWKKRMDCSVIWRRGKVQMDHAPICQAPQSMWQNLTPRKLHYNNNHAHSTLYSQPPFVFLFIFFCSFLCLYWMLPWNKIDCLLSVP